MRQVTQQDNSTSRNRSEVPCTLAQFFTTEVIPLFTFTGLGVLLSPLNYLNSVFLIKMFSIKYSVGRKGRDSYGNTCFRI